MLDIDPQNVIDRLTEFQRTVRDRLVESRRQSGLNQVNRDSAADTIYQIDTVVEPILEDFCRDWARTTPLVLVAEGVVGPDGTEGVKVYPEGSDPRQARIRLIVDPIDGTRVLMYDKRAAWALAGVAPNRGENTRLSDIEIAVMSELPTSKMGFCDVLWAVRGRGAGGRREAVAGGRGGGGATSLELRPSASPTLEHGFAAVTNFFPGTKTLAAETMEQIVRRAVPGDPTGSLVFEDQYISTGGQFYELIVGHDRFNADLRPLFYRIQNRPAGLCCHPYDCATMLIAQEAGVILTDGLGGPLDGPLDVTTPLTWAGYANPQLQKLIEPALTQFLKAQGITS